MNSCVRLGQVVQPDVNSRAWYHMREVMIDPLDGKFTTVGDLITVGDVDEPEFMAMDVADKYLLSPRPGAGSTWICHLVNGNWFFRSS